MGYQFSGLRVDCAGLGTLRQLLACILSLDKSGLLNQSLPSCMLWAGAWQAQGYP